MNIVAIRESVHGERRVPLTPQAVEKLVRLGATVTLEPGIGAPLHLSDEVYVKAGASFEGDRSALLKSADLLLTVQPPDEETVKALRPGAASAGFLDPFRNLDLVKTMAEHGVEGLCMELIPRTTYAQKMDALSSQASLAGYAAVIVAAERIDKSFPIDRKSVV